MISDEEPKLTRKQTPDFLSQRGFPISYRQLEKLCCAGEGPTPDYEWAGRFMYSPSKVLAWARSRSKPVPQSAESKGPGNAIPHHQGPVA